MEALDIHSTRELEDLCINTIYANLLTGKLSPYTQTFEITSCNSRDLALANHDYKGMISTLTQWSKQCDLALSEINERIRSVRAIASQKKQIDDEYERELENMKQSISSGRTSRSRLSGTSSSSSGTIQRGTEDDLEFMQDIEEELTFPPIGGESPTGRKRKLV
jgi:hypothetical protein